MFARVPSFLPVARELAEPAAARESAFHPSAEMESEILRLVNKYGRDTVETGLAAVQDYVERSVRQRIAAGKEQRGYQPHDSDILPFGWGSSNPLAELNIYLTRSKFTPSIYRLSTRAGR